MKLKSEWSRGVVYWRAFNKGDTVYMIGLREGGVRNGEILNYSNPSGFFQIELKRGDLFGPTLVAPGQVFANDDEYILTDVGDLVSVEQAAQVNIDPGFKFQPYNGLVQFFSAGSSDSAIKIVSSISQTTTGTGSTGSAVSSESTDETTGAVTGKETASTGDSLKLGIELGQSWSSKVSNKVSKVITNQLGIAIATQTNYSEDQSITLKAGKLTAVSTTWQRRYVTGSVVLGSLHLPYDATLGYLSSRSIQEFDSPDQLPPELLAEYQKQNPGYKPPLDLRDGSVLREVDDAPVYVLFGGAKFRIPDPQTLSRLYGGWGKVQVVPSDSLNLVPATPRDSTVLREENEAEVWLMQGGQKRHITTPTVLGRYGGWDVVRVVPDGATKPFPTGSPVT